MRIRYTETAADELADILDYIAERNPAAAKALALRIESSIQALADFPELAQTTDETGVRRLIIGRYPYVMFYTVEPDAIAILHVRHAARLSPWGEL
jgi:addiction module RelE/StbE family toxin